MVVGEITDEIVTRVLQRALSAQSALCGRGEYVDYHDEVDMCELYSSLTNDDMMGHSSLDEAIAHRIASDKRSRKAAWEAAGSGHSSSVARCSEVLPDLVRRARTTVGPSGSIVEELIALCQAAIVPDELGNSCVRYVEPVPQAAWSCVLWALLPRLSFEEAMGVVWQLNSMVEASFCEVEEYSVDAYALVHSTRQALRLESIPDDSVVSRRLEYILLAMAHVQTVAEAVQGAGTAEEKASFASAEDSSIADVCKVLFACNEGIEWPLECLLAVLKSMWKGSYGEDMLELEYFTYSNLDEQFVNVARATILAYPGERKPDFRLAVRSRLLSAAKEHFGKDDDDLLNEVGWAAMASLRDGNATALEDCMRRATRAANAEATSEALRDFSRGCVLGNDQVKLIIADRDAKLAQMQRDMKELLSFLPAEVAARYSHYR